MSNSRSLTTSVKKDRPFPPFPKVSHNLCRKDGLFDYLAKVSDNLCRKQASLVPLARGSFALG